MEMIQEDFPTLSGTEIANNIEIIDDYYSQNLDYEILNEVSEDETLSNRSRVSNRNTNFIDRLDRIERTAKYTSNYGHSYIRGLISLTISASAYIYAQTIFNQYSDANTKQDAFRHTLWNTFMCQFYLTLTSVNPRYNFARDAGLVNEILFPNVDGGKEMDLHNNEVGRRIWLLNTTHKSFLGVTTGLNTPTLETLIIHSWVLANNGKFIDKEGRKLSVSQVNAEILNTDINTPVYISNTLKQ